MNEAFTVESLEQLIPFLNDKGVLELVFRDGNRRYKAFKNVVLNLPQNEQQQMLKKTVDLLEKGSNKNKELINSLGLVSKAGIALNVANLCVSGAGFAVMCKKISEINRNINRIEETIKKGNDVWADKEFTKTREVYADMLDCRKKQNPYSEEQMRKLVSKEYSILDTQIKRLKNELSADQEELILSIFVLIGMFTVSLRYFDEVYYANNQQIPDKKRRFHDSHDTWMEVYSLLTSEEVIKQLQDFAFFEKNFHTRETDAYYISLLDQVAEQRQEIIENQTLMMAIDDVDTLQKIRDLHLQEIKKRIDTAFEQAGGIINNEAQKEYEKALQYAAIA